MAAYTPTYRAVHQRVNRVLGPASNHQCRDCDKQASEWAYDHQDPDEIVGEWHGRMVAYSAKPKHYVALCHSCHCKFDRAPWSDEQKQQISETVKNWWSDPKNREARTARIREACAHRRGVPSSGYAQHVQWHVNRNMVKPGCKHCEPA